MLAPDADGGVRRAGAPRSFRAASSSAWRWPARWRPRPRCCCSTSRCRRSTSSCARRCSASSSACRRETGITFVFVTHDQEEALTMSDRIGVMSAGRILQIGSPRDIYTAPANRFVADFIGETNFLTGQAPRRHRSNSTAAVRRSPCADVADGPVTLAVRPEQVLLGDGGRAGHGSIASIYFGTDMHRRSGTRRRRRIVTARVPTPPDGRVGWSAARRRASPSRPARCDRGGMTADASHPERSGAVGPENRRAPGAAGRAATGCALAPALVLLLIGASGPLLIVLVYSFLSPAIFRRGAGNPPLTPGSRIFFSRTSSTTPGAWPTRICRSSGARSSCRC